MIARPEIVRLAREGGVDERTQERDYVLAWLLAGMATEDFGLVLKGGTCLRLCYIRGYRYSEDLDFTLATGASPIAVVDAASAWCRFLAREAGIRADAMSDPAIARKRGWVSFTGPLGARREQAIKIDVADDEDVVDEVVRRPLLSDYSDLPDAKFAVPAYSLTEIWAEKTRSLMQRAEPRDAYDLAQLNALDGELAGVAHEAFEHKARAKGLNPEALSDRLEARETSLRRNWNRRLSDQVTEVPDFESTWRAVRRALRQAGYF